MNLLHGIEAPDGDGMVVEVHLDIMEAPQSFLSDLVPLGFADDPFLDFFPSDYRYHYTGRTRTDPKELHALLPLLNALVADVLGKAGTAGIRMYAESELVRDIRHFAPGESTGDLSALDGFYLAQAEAGAAAKADVHVEFRAGTVPDQVRSLLNQGHFYWVRTPASDRFPSEEIATLQAAAFGDASQLYERLVREPLPGCTGIHLEQKLGMVPSHPGLPMPPVVTITPA